MTDEEIEELAFSWVKKNKKQILSKFAPEDIYTKDALPTTLFMAGSPGAGKTETSRRLPDKFKQKPVIIDADEIRIIIPGYLGSKAFLFQKAASKGVHFLFDHCCSKDLNLILDGTFAYENAIKNVERSLKHHRNVEIYFIYQDPILSWEFTKNREKRENRNVPKRVFIDTFLKSISNAENVKRTYGPKIKLNVVMKNFNSGLEKLQLNADSVANYLPTKYNKEDLERNLP